MAARCLQVAENIWNTENDEAQVASKWKAAIELLIANNGSKDVYKQFIKDAAELNLNTENFGVDGWKAVRVLKYMDEDFNNDFEEALENYLPVLDSQISATPFGVPVEEGNAGVLDMAVSMGILNKYFPDTVSEQYTLSSELYLGTHMYNNTSWVAGVGTKSAVLGYGQNRAMILHRWWYRWL